MKHVWKRLMAALLCLAMIVPAAAVAEEDGKLYGVCTANSVRVRKQPKTSASVWFYVDEGHVAEILGEVKDSAGNVTWYKVESPHPNPNGRTYTGYIYAEYFRPLTEEDPTDPPVEEPSDPPADEPSDPPADEPSDPPADEPDPEATPRPSTEGYVGGSSGYDGVEVTGAKARTKGGTNFRTAPSTSKGKIICEIPRNTELDILAVPQPGGKWYCVAYNGKVGYVNSGMIEVLNEGTPIKPEGGTEVTDTWGEITADAVRFRIGAGTSYSIICELDEGTRVEVLTIPEQIGSKYWYCVRYNGQIGYVQSNYVRIVSSGSSPEDEEDSGEAAATGEITATGVDFRLGPGQDYDSLGKLDAGTVVELLTIPDTIDSKHWYKVRYNGQTGYIQANYIRVLTGDEEDQPVNGEYGYVITIDTGVFLRIQPADEKIAQLPINTIVPCAGEPLSPDESGTRYTWYYVYYNGMYGYLRGDYVRVCTADGGEIAPDDQPEDSPALTDTKGKLLKNTNFRSKPSTSSDKTILTVIKAGTVVEVLSIPENTKNGWYTIRYNGVTGYVHASLLTVLSQETDEEEPSAYGYVMITGTGVYVRDGVEGDGLTKVGKGTVWPMTGVTITKNGVNWYPVRANGYTGYVNGTYAFKLSPAQEESYLKGDGVPEDSTAPDTTLTAYVIVTHNQVNLRGSYSTESPRHYQVNKNTVMPCLGSKKVGGVTWYNVVYEGLELWVHSGYSRLMTVAEYEEWLGGTPEVKPEETPSEGFVKTVDSYVPVRSAANGKTVLVRLNEGVVLRYYEENISAGGYKWFRVMTPDGQYGYVCANLVEKCAEDGGPVPVTPPDLGEYDSASPSQQETSYSTLKLGSSGDKVKNLVQELINQGYYTGSVTSSYTSAVQAAVKAFQTVNGLTVDGIAGSQTQHKLFGTVPIGSGNTDDLSFEIYPVEKIDWYTGGIQQLIPRGANFKVYDVKTGIVWWAHRWAGSRHADIETLTAADSARLCEIYGVDNLQEIVDENMWERRPCLITIGTRTFAASLDGMQHGTDTIANNGMDGQICLHFTNSEGHSSQAVSTSHKEAIEYAYNNCPAGQKK